MKEIWKDIPDYEGLYQISNTGRVKSLPKKAGGSYRKEKILRNQLKKTGYFQIKLSKDSSDRVMLIHRLIAEAFIENVENKPFINHINAIRNDNRIENLEWCTQSENVIHAYKLGNMNAKGRNNGRYKFKHRKN